MANMTTLQILQGVHDWVLDKIDEETANFITKTVNDLVNYYTKSETYTKAEVQQIVDAIKQFTYEVVQVLPTASASTMNKIYLVPAPKSEDKNVKEEYITIQDGSTYSWEMLGTTSIDLSNYYTKGQTDSAISSALSSALASYTTTADLTTLLSQKQDVIQDLADIRSGASAGSTAVQPSTLNDVVKNVVAESGVYDVSANNDNTKFESLSALLSSANLNTLIPTDIRKGGMSIKFVLSSDNKYVQFRYMGTSTDNADFTNVANWQGIDAIPTEGSRNLVESGGVYNEVARLQGEIDTLDEDKADKDKNHELLGAGIANSVRGGSVSESTFLMREATESGVGQIEDIKGNAFAWNQLYNDSVPTAVTNHKYFLTELDGSTRNKSISTTIAYTADSTERNCIDLTLLGIDRLTTVEEVEAWLAQNVGLRDYYPYNAGELLPVRMTGMKTTGADNAWEKLASVPVTSLKGKLNGQGNSVVVFPDGMKSVGNVYDEIYVENGVTKAIKRVGSVDMSSLGFTTNSTENVFSVSFLLKKKSSRMLCAKYEYQGNASTESLIDKHIGGGGSGRYVMVKDTAYTDAATFKTAMRGVLLYYVLATPEVYVLDDFEMPVNYKVEDGGTEEVVNPVGEPEGTLTGSAPTLGIRYSVDMLERLEGFVSAKKAQGFTSTEKTQARSNIGAMVDTAIDNAPADGSENLISSGAVLTHGNALDVSVLNGSGTPFVPATYASLDAAIAAVPVANRTGGMSIKFIQSSDNKYVQFRYMGTSTANADFMNIYNWQGVDDGITPNSIDLVKGKDVFNLLDSKNLNIGDVTGEYRFEGIFASKTTGTGYVRKYLGDIGVNSNEKIILKVVPADVNGATIKDGTIDLRSVAQSGSTYYYPNVSLNQEYEYSTTGTGPKGFCIRITGGNVITEGYVTLICKRVLGSLYNYISRSSIVLARFQEEKVPSIVRTANLRFSITFQATTANIYSLNMQPFSFTLAEETTFEVASYEGVYLNVYNGTLFKATIGAGKTQSKAAMLLFGVYNNTPFGVLANYYFSERARTFESNISDINDELSDINDELSDINDELSDLTDGIPSYFVDNVNQAIEKIKTNMAAVGRNGESFIFISDMHWDRNEKNSPKLVRKILNSTNIIDVLSTGDLINESKDKSVMATALIDCVKAFSFDGHPLITTRGNHDDNSNWASQEDRDAYSFTFNEYYSYFMKQMEGFVTYLGTDASFYYDKPDTKTRYIFLDSARNGTVNGGSGAIQNSVNLLNATEAGWKIVFIQHFPTGTGMNAIKAMVDGCNDRSNAKVIPSYDITADFSNAQCECVAIFAGHTHADGSSTTDGGVPIIIIDTDCLGRKTASEQAEWRGTYNEQCFDVVTMDYVNKTIKCVRVGRGIDRTFTY